MSLFIFSYTLINFEGEYYEYGDSLDAEQRGLAIGGFESAWLSDVVMAFLMENTKNLFEYSIFSGFYRDDGLVFFKDSKKCGTARRLVN